MPFAGFTVNQIYNVQKRLIQDINSSRCEYLTNFVFVIIDEECIQSSPYQCLVCCDAPDHGETEEEIRLKQLRMPISEAMQYLFCLEQLSMTPSEVQSPNRKVHNVMPEPFLMPADEKRIEGAFFNQVRLATAAEARANKKIGLFMNMHMVDNRKTTVVEVPAEECKYVAEIFRRVLYEFRLYQFKHLNDGRKALTADIKAAKAPSYGEESPDDDGYEENTDEYDENVDEEEEDPQPPKGDTCIYARPSKQRIDMYYGNNTPFHASHVAYRKAAFPDKVNDSE